MLGCVSGCRDILNNWAFGFVADVYLVLPEFDPGCECFFVSVESLT